MSASQNAVKTFFKAKQFAVVGASTDQSKFGYKVFAWYLDHKLPVTPINPKKPTILSTESLASIADLPSPEETSLSVITPPKVTLATIKQAIDLKFKAVWLQPGSFDDEVLKLAREAGLPTVAGYEDGTVGGEGWCVLVDGEHAMKAAGRKGPEWGKL